jgi:hypothetical protein
MNCRDKDCRGTPDRAWIGGRISSDQVPSSGSWKMQRGVPGGQCNTRSQQGKTMSGRDLAATAHGPEPYGWQDVRAPHEQT